ncbi:FHA domain-containing protein [Leucobacter sp. USHLN153]|uniref:FHA domain-containing protein n=1 Tax=Leucobacter sp. USHLN153 TaxID=3081268 RepID=UPI00301A491E
MGARIGAYSIDAAVCLALAAIAWMLTRSLLIGVLVLVELAVILLVIEARTGVTVGNLLLRLRTARDDSPFSPGMGRGFVRGLVQGAGSLVALVGGWAVVATSAADPMRMGRSWADRAGRTLVVKVPSEAERAAWSRSAEAWAQSAPRTATEATAVPPGATAPQAARPAAATVIEPDRQERDAAVGSIRPPSATQGAPVASQPGPAEPVPAAEAAPALPEGVIAVDAPIPPAPAPRRTTTLLLLSFDTGQRVQLRIPTVVNLGRRPEASDPADQLVTVEDPAGSVSKTHLRLEYRGDSVWVTDLGSTNGSEMVDDTGEVSQLPTGARVRMETGASVRIGERSFTAATVTGEV